MLESVISSADKMLCNKQPDGRVSGTTGQGADESPLDKTEHEAAMG